jgi:hypothetical protein
MKKKKKKQSYPKKKKKQSYPIQLRTPTSKFYDGWSKERFEEERIKIAMNISLLTRSQREFVINSFKNDTKTTTGKTPDNINE